MTITPEIWRVLVAAVASIQTSPTWLREQAQLSWEAVSRLPVLDLTIAGEPSIPVAERKILSADYLAFLRDQINRNTRGAEWLALLQNRLNALEPYAGKELLVAMFHCKPHSATLRINPDTGAVVHAEMI